MYENVKEVDTMRNIFPQMHDRPETGRIVAGGAYWFVFKIILPFLAILGAAGVGGSGESAIGMYIFYSLVNLICTVLIFRPYLQESFWNARLDKELFVISVGLGLAVYAVLEIILVVVGILARDPMMFVCFPVGEPLLGISSTYWAMAHPVILGLVMVLLVPVTHCCLYYGVGFAAPCQERPWLGYLIVILISVVPALLLVTSGGRSVGEGLAYFVGMLPFHVCACWIYQNSDTIWGPIVFQAVVNLVTIPVSMILLFVSALSFGTT